MTLGLLELVQMCTCSADVSLVTMRRLRGLVINMYALQLIFLLELEIVVKGYMFIVFVRQQ